MRESISRKDGSLFLNRFGSKIKCIMSTEEGSSFRNFGPLEASKSVALRTGDNGRNGSGGERLKVNKKRG